MGKISDITNEQIFRPIDLNLAAVDSSVWKNMTEIVRYTNRNFYEYMNLTVDGIEDDRIWFASSTIRIAQDIIDARLNGILDPIKDSLSRSLQVYGSFWSFIERTIGFVYNSATSTYGLTSSGFISRIDSRVSALERKADPFTDTEMQKLNWLIDHYDDFNRLINDDINYVINEVMGKIEPRIYAAVEAATAPYNQRLIAVESALSKTQFWFWDILIDVWAFLAGGSILPIGQIEDSMKVVGEWFIDMIDEILLPMAEKLDEFAFGLGEHILGHDADVKEQVLEAILGINVLTMGQVEQVRGLIETALSGVGAGKGEKGDPGRPGERGAKGEPGAPGEPGEVGDVNINNINNELYIKLWNAGAITTNTFTGVVDWMLEAYGLRFADLQEQLTPITEFFTDETKTALTALVDKFGTPEAIISFLIPDSEGQEGEVLDLMQILISMTFEREN
jgi:hypothetical protein